MTSYERPTERPAVGKFSGFAYVEFRVSNAKQVSDWYCLRFGFKRVAYTGLETGNKTHASHVINQGDIMFVFTSPLTPEAANTEICREIAEKGDAVKDVAFFVDDVKGLYDKAVSRGAVGVREPTELKDENGTATIATVRTYGVTNHTFVNKDGYKGRFLPGYKDVDIQDELAEAFGSPNLMHIDHCVGNQPDLKMTEAAEFYVKTLDFHRFWSVDDTQMRTEFSALRSIVVTDFDETVKMPINEPAPGKKKSQIQEYVEFHGGAGVQHIALRTDNIIETITNLRRRGVDFLNVPDTYYEDLRKRLAKSAVRVEESLDTIQKLKILVDFDEKGYLLQLFTKPVEDRPTLFLEFIQRHNHQGFGAGNFKALFEAIEREQANRGTL